MLYLKQSTAGQAVLIGPFVDATDGTTAETALSIANTDIRLSANGGNLAAKTSGGATHDEAGWYTTTLDATDTATVGRLQLHCKMAGALMVHAEFQVLEEAVFDALIGASALGYVANAPVNVAQLSGDATAADNAEAFFDGTGYAGTNNVIPTVTDVTNLHASAATAAALATVDGNVDAILADTGTDGVVVAAASKTGYTLTATTGLGNQTANITGNLSGSVGSVTGAINTAAGTITTLDGLDTAQDTQHGTTQAAIADVPTVAEFEARTIAAASYFDPAADRVLLDKADALRVTGAVNDVSATTTVFVTTLAEATDDHYIGRVVIFTSGALLGQASDITDYNGTTKAITVTALTEAPADSVTFEIV